MTPHETLSCLQFRRRAFIYGWKRNGKYLYIGQTTNGFSRVCNHHVIGIKEEIQEKDVLDIWNCSVEELNSLESKLIIEFKPLYNHNGKEDLQQIEDIPFVKGQCPCCGKKLINARSNKIFCNSVCKFRFWNKKHPRINLTSMEPK